MNEAKRSELDAPTGSVDRLRADVKRWKALYLELIYEVATKVDGESRHDTARRYICERENHTEGPCSSVPNV